MSKLANLSDTIGNARTILGLKNSFAWQVFEQVNGKRTSAQIAKILDKQHTNVSYRLGHLENMGLLEERKRIGNATIYQKIPELKSLKKNSRSSKTKATSSKKSKKAKSLHAFVQLSHITNKIIEIGQTHGIQNIDKNWIDSLVILNFMETACTKFFMDHGYTEDQVRDLKWGKKFKQMQDILFQEAKAKKFPIRTASSISFFKGYNDTRNEQDHIAHLPKSKVHKTDVNLLKSNLTILIKTAFNEHKQYCPLAD